MKKKRKNRERKDLAKKYNKDERTLLTDENA